MGTLKAQTFSQGDDIIGKSSDSNTLFRTVAGIPMPAQIQGHDPVYLGQLL
jgi:hypothetical protein